ncbi:uncharacterized protein LOC115715062 isoform X1 [Cannabis sativa]|uniref:uncharacterized protein LOC115715062 isoform X1 n=2 Tax=Cannabis sativa TaxID=3483 RepID=UPI0029CA3222|nr:uncharacterized protein LOC115715062 isoform X1 [Cannabis sativa]XP_030499715.2 uncharacterized protein LOC115715062 isoform X1 [Cannabis sativa]
MNDQQALHLLNELELILESDPLIDEVGFIHPSQFDMLNEEACHLLPSSDDTLSSKVSDIDDASKHIGAASFWNKDHKLGISTEVLFPLYQTTKHAFMAAIKQYKALVDNSCIEDSSSYSASSHDNVENEVMKLSRALLLLSCDFGTAWHSRKLAVSKKHRLSMLMYELQLSALVLSYAPKCEHAWSHRRWVIKSIAGRCSTLQNILEKESELVEKIAERSKMNYRAWNHRNWLVSYMSGEQVLHELKKTRSWAGLHVADNSCFHYRRRLMLRILEDSKIGPVQNYVDINQLWEEELEWNEMLIKLYVGREALWLHRRFLAPILLKGFLIDHTDTTGTSIYKDFDKFVDNEFKLHSFCSTVPESSFEDHHAQALHCATYMLWLIKFIGIEFQEKLRVENLKSLLKKICPEKPFLWDHLTNNKS